MVSFRLPVCTVFLIAIVFQVSALDSYIAAVYEHAVVLSEATSTPVTPKEAFSLMDKNLDILEGAVRAAAEQVRWI